MRALVISGGGSKGAFAGGIADYLITDLGKQYDVFCGTSTGSLLVPLLAAKEIEKIKQIYCNVTQHDIFSNCPFVVRKTENGYRTRFNHKAILWQFLKGRKTLGESKGLRELIRQCLTPEIFEKIREGHPEVIITVSNLTNGVIEYKYARDWEYEDYCDWIWISANTVPFMSLVVKNGCEYADGGFGNLVPVQEAIDYGAKEIDVIILNPRHSTQPTRPSRNAFTLMMKSFHFMLYQIGVDDVNIALLEGRHGGIKINLIHTPRMLTENSFVFDPEQMRGWWKEGYDYARYLYSGVREENS